MRHYSLIAAVCLAVIGHQSAFCAAEGAPQPPASSGWWKGSPWTDPNRGFLWYPPEHEESPAEEPQEQPVRKAKPLEKISDFQELKDEIEWRKQIAIMAPTPESLHDYLEAQKYAMTKAGRFADVWRRTVWESNGELTFNNIATTSGTASQDRLYKQNTRTAFLKSLGGDYGLYFFYKQDCRFCHMQAPTMRMFQATFGIPVMGIGLDGSKLQELPNSRPDNGISTIVTGGAGIQVTPAIYLFSRKDKSTIPLAVGTISVDDLAERIRVLLDPTSKDDL